MHRLRRTAAFATAVSFVGALVFSAPAHAQTSAPDLWYHRMGVAEAHAEGWTGEGVTIAVIDSMINPDLEVFAGTNLVVDTNPLCPDLKQPEVTTSEATELSVHGSDVVALLIGNGTGPGAVQGIVPDAKVLFYGVGTSDADDWADRCGSSGEQIMGIEEGIIRALDAGADVISISLGGALPMPANANVSYARALAEGVIILGGVPNGVKDVETLVTPWGLNGVVAVGSFTPEGQMLADEFDFSRLNIHPEVTVVAPGGSLRTVNWAGDQSLISGTSYATPITAGVVAANIQKYPQVTGNQIIQSLILNTTAEQLALLEQAEMPSPTTEPTTDAPQPAATDVGDSFANTMLWTGIGAAVVGALAVVIVLIVMTRSRARERRAPAGKSSGEGFTRRPS